MSNETDIFYRSLLHLQWKREFDEANRLIRQAIEIDDKCDFAYETLATLEVQRYLSLLSVPSPLMNIFSRQNRSFGTVLSFCSLCKQHFNNKNQLALFTVSSDHVIVLDNEFINFQSWYISIHLT